MNFIQFSNHLTFAGGNRIVGQGCAAWSLATIALISFRHPAILCYGPQFHEEFRGR